MASSGSATIVACLRMDRTRWRVATAVIPIKLEDVCTIAGIRVDISENDVCRIAVIGVDISEISSVFYSSCAMSEIFSE
ncbi:hypothetical protein OsI_34734 [Oryza sativa Indica Group]|uniref:Uncharacterized protein n=1 Tax=Oryza sativa subsp. indica TaxID=39946 RepID=B8BID0_ORYSI|nr:hypothetical protein OsI_34734 [Oryza sativa Indica Group]